MGNGRYCDKHGEWAPDGQCRWCEPPNGVHVDVVVSGLEPLPPEKSAQLQSAMNESWVRLAKLEAEAKKAAVYDEPSDAPATQPSNLQALHDRNNKFAEIGRAFYEDWRAGFVVFGGGAHGQKTKDLCETLAASEAKSQAAGKLHEPNIYRPEVKHLTGFPVHCPCGCCCS